MTARFRHSWPYLVVALVAIPAAYYALFSTFSSFDDEGYVLVSLQNFIDGGSLYNEVFSQYGPFYHEFFGAFFKITGVPLTNDSARWVVLALWIAVATGYGLLCERLTNNRFAGIASQILAFGVLALLTSEPLHPIGLTTALVLVLIAAATWWPDDRPQKTAVAVGVALAALTLTKINMGALAAVGVVVAAAFTLGPPQRNLRIAATLLLALAPLALVAGNIDESWVVKLLALEGAALAAIVVRVWDVRFQGPGIGLRRWLARLVGAGAVFGFVAAVIIVFLGTSVPDLVDGVLLEPARHPSVILIATQTPLQALIWALAAIAAATVVAVARHARPEPKELLAGALARFFAAAVIVFTLAGAAPLALMPSAVVVVLPMLLAWTAAVAPAGRNESRMRAFGRLALVLIAVLEVMQAYPIGFSRVDAGALTFVAVAALLIADGLFVLERWRARSSTTLQLSRVVTAVMLALIVTLFVSQIADPAQEARNRYKANTALDFPGAERLRIDPAQAAAYKAIVAQLGDCDPLVTVPGFYSFHLWSEKPTPTGQNANDWVVLLSKERQQQIVDAIKDKPKLCVLRNLGSIVVGNSLSTKPPLRDPPLRLYLDGLQLQTIVSADIGRPNGRFDLYKRAVTK